MYGLHGLRVCMYVCMYEGISILPEVTPTQPQQTPVEHNKCKTCGLKFIDWEEAETCPICKKRKQLHFLFN